MQLPSLHILKAMISKILIPVDGSEHANKALQYALDLAEKYDATITIVHVAARLIHAYGAIHGAVSIESNASLLAEGNEILKRAREMANGSEVSIERIESKLVEGNAAEEILKMADSEQFDLIVMGSRGLNPIKAFFLGSTSNRVSHHAKCPVLIVK